MLADYINNGPTPALPTNHQLAQNANHLCQHCHPKDPKDPHFDLAEDFIPQGFVCKDVTVDGCHHLLFATDKIITLFSKAKNWFIDSTFKVVHWPFTQFHSKHALIKSDDCLKQVPPMFVVRSGKCKKDYKKVFKAVKFYFQTCVVVVQTVTIEVISECTSIIFY